MEIKSIWDNGGLTIDRYTIVTTVKSRQYLMMLGLSDNPTHPQGVSMWGEGIEGEHLGKKIDFNDLPNNIQVHVLEKLKEN